MAKQQKSLSPPQQRRRERILEERADEKLVTRKIKRENQQDQALKRWAKPST